MNVVLCKACWLRYVEVEPEVRGREAQVAICKDCLEKGNKPQR